MNTRNSFRRNPAKLFKLFLKVAFALFTFTLLVVVASDENGIDRDFVTNLTTEAVGIAVTFWIIDRLRDRNDTAFQNAAEEIKQQFHEETSRLVEQLQNESKATLDHLERQSKRIDDTLARRRGLITDEMDSFQEMLKNIREEWEGPTLPADDKSLEPLEGEDDFDPPTQPAVMCNYTNTQEINAIRADIQRIRRSLYVLSQRIPSDKP